MTFAWIGTAAAVLALSAATGAQAQDWKPQGPVRMMIAFSPGGGADTMGRLLAEEIRSRHGWDIIPENVTGKGGVSMAVELKDEPADGTSVGVTVTEVMTYSIQTMRKPPYALDDFTFLSTLAGTQIGIIARRDRGWQTLVDVIAAAKAGETITVGAMSQRLADATYVLGLNNGIEFNTVVTGGGKASLNAVVADDVDIGWSGGPQTAAVKAGEITNLASAEAGPLQMQPEAPQVQDFNLPYDFGVKFFVAAPAGIPDAARETWQHHIAEILNDPDSKLHQFTHRAFSGPVVVQGADLEQLMQDSYDDAAELLAASVG